MIEFLHYIEDSTDKTIGAIKSERVKRIHDRVCKVKLNEEIGVKYMQAWEEKYYEQQEGKEEGRLETLVSLVCKKINKGFTVSEISDMLEEDERTILKIYDIAVRYAPQYDIGEIVEKMLQTAD